MKRIAEAEEKRDLHDSLVNPLVGLSMFGAHTNADFSNLPLDENIESVQSAGSHGNFDALKSIAGEASINIAEAGRIYGRGVMCPRLVGTAKDVADEMAEIVTSGAAGGFVVSPAFLPETFESFVDAVVLFCRITAVRRRELEPSRWHSEAGKEAGDKNCARPGWGDECAELVACYGNDRVLDVSTPPEFWPPGSPWPISPAQASFAS
jgi:hypothetical protein